MVQNVMFQLIHSFCALELELGLGISVDALLESGSSEQLKSLHSSWQDSSRAVWQVDDSASRAQRQVNIHSTACRRASSLNHGVPLATRH